MRGETWFFISFHPLISRSLFRSFGSGKFVGPFTSFIGEGRRSQRAPFSSSSSNSNSVKLIQLAVLLLEPKFNKLLEH